MHSFRLPALCLLLIGVLFNLYGKEQSPLKIITINIWSGSDYHGTTKFGMWENPAQREQRYKLLVKELKSAKLDVIFIQEANPVDRYTRRLAQDLNMSQIHQICIAGIKLLGLGIPWGFKEGNAILARKNLQLGKLEDWKLSGSPGLYSDNFSFQLDETVSALLGQIIVQGKLVNLLCVHLSAAPENDAVLQDSLNQQLTKGTLTQKEYQSIQQHWKRGIERRDKETTLLLKKIKHLPKNIPLIVGGDFNSSPESKVIRTQKRYCGNFGKS